METLNHEGDVSVSVDTYQTEGSGPAQEHLVKAS